MDQKDQKRKNENDTTDQRAENLRKALDEYCQSGSSTRASEYEDYVACQGTRAAYERYIRESRAKK
jgi:hypothetical protein